jgi:hypothetical protein
MNPHPYFLFIFRNLTPCFSRTSLSFHVIHHETLLSYKENIRQHIVIQAKFTFPRTSLLPKQTMHIISDSYKLNQKTA